MRWRVVILLAGIACSANEAERAQRIAERRQARDTVMSSAIVQAARTPTTAGRLIYERPAALSYDSMVVKRPDLVTRRR